MNKQMGLSEREKFIKRVRVRNLSCARAINFNELQERRRKRIFFSVRPLLLARTHAHKREKRKVIAHRFSVDTERRRRHKICAQQLQLCSFFSTSCDSCQFVWQMVCLFVWLVKDETLSLCLSQRARTKDSATNRRARASKFALFGTQK